MVNPMYILTLLRNFVITASLMFLSFLTGILISESELKTKYEISTYQKLEAQAEDLMDQMIFYCETEGVFEIGPDTYICSNVDDLLDNSTPIEENPEYIL